MNPLHALGLLQERPCWTRRAAEVARCYDSPLLVRVRNPEREQWPSTVREALELHPELFRVDLDLLLEPEDGRGAARVVLPPAPRPPPPPTAAGSRDAAFVRATEAADLSDAVRDLCRSRRRRDERAALLRECVPAPHRPATRKRNEIEYTGGLCRGSEGTGRRGRRGRSCA